MSEILKDIFNEDVEKWDMKKIIMEIAEIKKRLSELEKQYDYGGVFVDGSTEIVKEYYNELVSKNKKGDI